MAYGLVSLLSSHTLPHNLVSPLLTDNCPLSDDAQKTGELNDITDDVQTSCDGDVKKGRLWLLLALRIMRSVIELHLRCHDDVTSCDRC